MHLPHQLQYFNIFTSFTSIFHLSDNTTGASLPQGNCLTSQVWENMKHEKSRLDKTDHSRL